MGVYSNSGVITIVNSGGTSFVANLTAGSFVSFSNAGPGPGTFQFNIESAYTGTLVPYFSADGINLEPIEPASITKFSTGAFGAVPANALGTFTSDCPAGQVFLIASALSAGTPSVTISYTVSIGGASGEPGIPSEVTVLSNALGSPGTAQVVIATTGTAVQLPSLAAVNGVTVSADILNATLTNTPSGGVTGPNGVTQSNGYRLSPGSAVGFAASNANQLYVNGISGDRFSVAVS